MPYCPSCSASVPEGVTTCPTCGSPLIPTPSAGDEDEPRPAALDTAGLRDELGAALAPGYQILKPLGVGGMGAVFLAREPALRRLVAVKVLSPSLSADPRARARFEREARAAAALSHPNVVRVYAVGDTPARRLPYIIMQYVEGPTLAQWMTQHRRASEREARRTLGEVAAGLAAAHARDMVHRDVKPSNVLIEADSGRAFVVDFGVSAALSPGDQSGKLTMTGMVVGTPAYMSPEQASGDAVTPKSDVYSLGLLAYELVTGALPYQATTAMGWAAAHLRDPATPVNLRRPDLSPDVARLIDRCLAKDPATRPDARDVARAMAPSLESEIAWPPPGLAWLHRRGRLVARLSLLSALGGLLTMFALAFTPRILQVHTYWLGRFSAAALPPAVRLGEFRGDIATTSQFVWQTVLILGLATLVSSLLALVLVGTQAVTFALARRARGWHWTTLLDVAVDHDGRTGAVLAGGREFASLDTATRHTILVTRRLQTGAEAGGGAWVTAVGFGWLGSLALGTLSNESSAGALSPWIWWTAAVPAVTCLLVSAACRYRERRLAGTDLGRPRFEESGADVKTWYASTPQAPAAAQPRRPPHRLAMVGAQLLVLAVAGLFLAGLGVAALAALIAAAATAREGPATVRLAAAIAQTDAQDPLGTARAAAAPYLPPPQRLADSTLDAQLRALIGLTPHRLPDYQPAPATLRAALRAAAVDRAPNRGFRPPPDSPSAQPARGGRMQARELFGATVELLRRATARQIPPDTVRLLLAIGNHPRTTVFREVSRATHWDLVDALGDRELESAAGWAIASISLSRVAEAALGNYLGAIGDLARGDLPGARRRLGENAAAGLRLLDAPSWEASTMGRSTLESLALVPLAELEQLQGNGRQASELRQAAQRLAPLESLGLRGLEGLAADPQHLEPATNALRDPRLPAGWRAALMGQLLEAACTNPREILVGPSRTRLATLRATADSQAFQHADELVTLVEQRWRGHAARIAPSGVLAPLNRIANCLGQS